MGNDCEHYKYNKLGDLGHECAEGFNSYFSVIFKSFRIHKANFIFQAINFTLILLLVNYIISPYVQNLTKAEGSSLIGANLFLSFILMSCSSVIKGNKILRWQTLFDTGMRATTKIFLALLIIFALLFGIKQYERPSKN